MHKSDFKAFIATQGGIPGMGNGPELDVLFQAVRMAGAQSVTEFIPDPSATKEIIRARYRAKRTQICSFREDSIDQSDVIAELLHSSQNDGMLRTTYLDGNHLSPVYISFEVRRLCIA